MRRSLLGFRKPWGWFVLLPALFIACDDNDDDLSPEQSKARTEVAAKDNSRIFAVTQEVLDLTSLALLEKGVSSERETSGGRLNEKLTCYPTISASYDVKKSADSVVYDGIITVDFEDGSSCTDSVSARRGKITDKFRYVISYQDSVPVKATETITFEGFEKDSVKVDGTFINSLTSDGSRNVDIVNAVLAYPDGTSATWNGQLSYRSDDGGTPFKPVDDIRSLSGSLTGTTREGVNFNSSIAQALQYANQCGDQADIPTSGVVELVVGTTNAQVDYGDGTCDTSYTITVNGETTAYESEPTNL